MTRRWSVVRTDHPGTLYNAVVEAEVLRLEGGCLVFVTNLVPVACFSPEGWRSVTLLLTEAPTEE